MTYPKTLHESDGRRVVALSENFTRDHMTHLHADLTEDGALFVRHSQDFALDSRLSAEEADAFVIAWTALRESQRQADLAEVQRKNEMSEKAFDIARKYAEILIDNDNEGEDVAPWWRVTLPALHIYFERDAAQDPASLLSQVEKCKEAWDLHLKAEETRNAEQQRLAEEVKEANVLAERAGIEIERQGDGKGYSLYLDNIRYRFNIPARSLLEAVQSLSKLVIRIQSGDGSIIA